MFRIFSFLIRSEYSTGNPSSSFHSKKMFQDNPDKVEKSTCTVADLIDDFERAEQDIGQVVVQTKTNAGQVNKLYY